MTRETGAARICSSVSLGIIDDHRTTCYIIAENAFKI
jgi:hypothetical protein